MDLLVFNNGAVHWQDLVEMNSAKEVRLFWWFRAFRNGNTMLAKVDVSVLEAYNLNSLSWYRIPCSSGVG